MMRKLICEDQKPLNTHPHFPGHHAHSCCTTTVHCCRPGATSLHAGGLLFSHSPGSAARKALVARPYTRQPVDALHPARDTLSRTSHSKQAIHMQPAQTKPKALSDTIVQTTQTTNICITSRARIPRMSVSDKQSLCSVPVYMVFRMLVLQ